MNWPDVINGALPVVGTLAGGWGGIWLTTRAANRARTEARRDATTEALAELLECLDRHRAVMLRMVSCRLAAAANLIPADPATATEDLHASHASRAAITRPLTMLCVRAPALATQARTATRAAYVMHRATRLVDLERRRAAALHAAEDLVDAASRVLGLPTDANRRAD